MENIFLNPKKKLLLPAMSTKCLIREVQKPVPETIEEEQTSYNCKSDKY